jgi:LmbE family N-acetylglucosaminyl deacetylase
MPNKTILIIAAHPDDELLGCAGTVRKYIKRGYKTVSVILGEGMRSRGKITDSSLKKLKADACNANKKVGIDKVCFESLPDNQFDSVPLLKIIKIVEKYFAQYSPDIIFTHFAHDLNVDHRLTFQAVMTACRPQPGFKHPDIYSFEVPSSTDYNEIDIQNVFVPNTYIDINEEIDLKLSALALYKTEMKEYPHSRSIEGIKIMAQSRGAKVGLRFAEAFQLVRSVKN